MLLGSRTWRPGRPRGPPRGQDGPALDRRSPARTQDPLHLSRMQGALGCGSPDRTIFEPPRPSCRHLRWRSAVFRPTGCRFLPRSSLAGSQGRGPLPRKYLLRTPARRRRRSRRLSSPRLGPPNAKVERRGASAWLMKQRRSASGQTPRYAHRGHPIHGLRPATVTPFTLAKKPSIDADCPRLACQRRSSCSLSTPAACASCAI